MIPFSELLRTHQFHTCFKTMAEKQLLSTSYNVHFDLPLQKYFLDILAMHFPDDSIDNLAFQL